MEDRSYNHTTINMYERTVLGIGSYFTEKQAAKSRDRLPVS